MVVAVILMSIFFCKQYIDKYKKDFNRFLIELTPKFRESGLYVILEDNNITDEKKSFMIYRKDGLPIARSVSDPEEFLPYYLKGGSK